MGFFNATVQDQRVYAQSEEPGDRRDGVLWVDTGAPERPLFVFSSDTGTWEATSPEAVSKQTSAPSAPSLGDLWVDTDADPVRAYVWNGSAWLDVTVRGMWEELDSVSGSLPITLDVSGESFDSYRVTATINNDNGTDASPCIQFNGLSSGYEAYNEGGGRQTGASFYTGFADMNPTANERARVDLSIHAVGPTLTWRDSSSSGDPQSKFGGNLNTTGLDTVKLYDDANVLSGTVRIFGRNEA